jgi:ferric-dicitrate binding protein FerR (iron transport regulator)
MNEQEITELITRVLANEASADEKLRLEQWRKEHADNEIQFEQTRLIWDNAALFKEEVDTDAAWEKFSARLKASKKTISLKYYLQIAAARYIDSRSWVYWHNVYHGRYTIRSNCLNRSKTGHPPRWLHRMAQP